MMIPLGAMEGTAGRVEFVGSPGSGKSTVFAAVLHCGGVVDRANVLLAGLRERSVDRPIRLAARLLPHRVAAPRAYDLFYRSLDHQRSIFRFGATRPELYSLVVRMTLEEPHPASRPWRLLQKHAGVQSMYQFMDEAPTSPRRPVLLDEEFVQMLLIGLANSRVAHPEQLAGRYLEHCPAPDVVVAIRATPETCLERLLSRPGRGFPLIMSSQDGPDFLRRLGDALDVVIEGARAAGVRVIEVNSEQNGDPPAGVGQRVHDALSK